MSDVRVYVCARICILLTRLGPSKLWEGGNGKHPTNQALRALGGRLSGLRMRRRGTKETTHRGRALSNGRETSVFLFLGVATRIPYVHPNPHALTNCPVHLLISPTPQSYPSNARSDHRAKARRTQCRSRAAPQSASARVAKSLSRACSAVTSGAVAIAPFPFSSGGMMVVVAVAAAAWSLAGAHRPG